MRAAGGLLLLPFPLSIACASRPEEPVPADDVRESAPLPFVIELGDFGRPGRAVVFPRVERLKDVSFYDGAFEEDVRRAVERALRGDPGADIESVVFYELRIRTEDGVHRELPFRVGDYADVELVEGAGSS